MVEKFWEFMHNHGWKLFAAFVIIGLLIIGYQVYGDLNSPETKVSLAQPITDMTRGELYALVGMAALLVVMLSGGKKS